VFYVQINAALTLMCMRIKKDGRSMTDMVIATLTNGLAEG
jgi:hypothetical protein